MDLEEYLHTSSIYTNGGSLAIEIIFLGLREEELFCILIYHVFVDIIQHLNNFFLHSRSKYSPGRYRVAFLSIFIKVCSKSKME